MAKTLFARGSDGLVSIHDAGTDYDNPLAHLNSIYFHSAFDYLRVVQEHVATVSLPFVGNVSADVLPPTLITVATHGLGFRPVVLAAWRAGNYRQDAATLFNAGYHNTNQEVPFAGTMIFDSGYEKQWHLSICADDQRVYLFASGFSFAASANSFEPVNSIPLRIWVFGNTAT